MTRIVKCRYISFCDLLLYHFILSIYQLIYRAFLISFLSLFILRWRTVMHYINFSIFVIYILYYNIHIILLYYNIYIIFFFTINIILLYYNIHIILLYYNIHIIFFFHSYILQRDSLIYLSNKQINLSFVSFSVYDTINFSSYECINIRNIYRS